jgi:hypothetical protein
MPRGHITLEASAMADDSRRKDFIDKLFQFRQTLPREEQKMLDSLVLHAETAAPMGDVQGYGWFFGTDATNPQYYQTGTIAPGQTSGWWSTYTDTNAFGNTPFA